MCFKPKHLYIKFVILVNINKFDKGDIMGTLSVSVPDDLRSKMDKFDEVNWSAVARKAFEEKVNEIEILKKIAGKSKLSEKDALELGKKINENMARRFQDM